MKIAINTCYGGFNFSDAFRKEYHGPVARDSEEFIEALENFGLDKAGGSFSRLAIVKIPDEATDWEISDYDGVEHVIFVLDGKLHHSY